MKKQFRMLALCMLLIVGSCGPKIAEPPPPPPVSMMKAIQADPCYVMPVADEIKPARAKELAAAYVAKVTRDPTFVIRYINMDAELLKQMICTNRGFMLISALGEDGQSTAILQLFDGTVNRYYDIRRLFNSSQTGMRGNPPVCPPPTPCDITY